MIGNITNELWTKLFNELKLPDNQKKICDSLLPLLNFMKNYLSVYFFTIVILLVIISILLILVLIIILKGGSGYKLS